MKFNAIQLQDDSFFVVTETVKGQKRGRQFGTHEEAHAFAVQMTVEYHLKKANELMSECDTSVVESNVGYYLADSVDKYQKLYTQTEHFDIDEPRSWLVS